MFPNSDHDDDTMAPRLATLAPYCFPADNVLLMRMKMTTRIVHEEDVIELQPARVRIEGLG